MIRRIVLLLVTLFCIAGLTYAQDARALYTETNLGGGFWRYSYVFYNDLSPATFVGYDLYDVSLTLDGSTTVINESQAANWANLVTTDFVEYFSVLAGEPPAGSDIAPGALLGGFEFMSDKQLGDLAFTASFVDPNDPGSARFYSGITAAAPTAAPEAPSGGLLVLGLLVLPMCLFRRTKHRLYRG
ncbi:MAG: hypothetical protein QM758_13555 [Armatimonas sp.]